MPHNPQCLAQLSDQDLCNRLQHCLEDERQQLVQILTLIAEVDRRRLYLDLGFPSMYEFAISRLHLSEAAAYRRITVARAARTYPALLLALARGEVHLSGLTALVPHLTQENHQALLNKARHQTKKAIEQLLAARSPKPDIAPSLRRLPKQKEATAAPGPQGHRASAAGLHAKATSTPRVPSLPTAAASELFPDRVHSPTPPEPPRPHVPAVAPLGQNRYALRLTLSQQIADKLKQAQDLSDRGSAGDVLLTVLEQALDLYIADRLKKKFALGRRTKTAHSPKQHAVPSSRHIPDAVRRAVYIRDGGQCTFVSPEGTRCSARARLELHHCVPYAQGGAHTSDNLRLLCRCHNAHQARMDFGERKITEHVATSRAQQRLSPAPTSNRIGSADGLPARVHQL